MTVFFQNFFGGIETGSMYALAAMGLVLIYQTAKIANFAQGTLGMFNAFVCTNIILRLGLPLPIAALLSIVIALIIGACIDFFIVSRAKKNDLFRKRDNNIRFNHGFSWAFTFTIWYQSTIF